VTVAGLFAGVGGFELAFAEAGYETVVLSEIDHAAQSVLKHRFPDATIIGDVAGLVSLPRSVDIVTAGFPCQNLSMAGDKSGIEGAKSSVVSELFRILDQFRPATVVIENVYFMLHLDRGRAMDSLLKQLEDLHYHWAYRVLDTSGFGLPQRRRRVYLVAGVDLDPREVLFADECPPTEPPLASLQVPLGFYWTEGRSGVGITVDGVPPIKGGSGLGIPSPPGVLFTDGSVLIPSLSASERLQGFPAGWIECAAPETRRQSWRLIGNAVSVPVAAWVASRIRTPGSLLDLDKCPLPTGDKWPDAAWNVGEGRFSIKASGKPLQLPKPSIEDFRDSTWTRLSERALDGFLKRADEGKLNFPAGFLEALRAARSSVSCAA
jgi:DNA (cytosine-5)-methyltransferase 1